MAVLQKESPAFRHGVDVNKDVSLKSGTTIPAGSEVSYDFDGGRTSSVRVTTADGSTFAISLERAHLFLSKFKKPPTMKTLEKWSNDGVCQTPTGHRVEPDGTGPDGSPSWLLAFGMI